MRGVARRVEGMGSARMSSRAASMRSWFTAKVEVRGKKLKGEGKLLKASASAVTERILRRTSQEQAAIAVCFIAACTHGHCIEHSRVAASRGASSVEALTSC